MKYWSYKKYRFEPRKSTHPYGYMTEIEFMEAVKIKRTKFDQLVRTNRIRTKKFRKIYVPVTEVDRYFKDSSIP